MSHLYSPALAPGASVRQAICSPALAAARLSACASVANRVLRAADVRVVPSERRQYRDQGGEAIVNATGWSVKDGYETNWLPSMRMIVDPGDLNNSVAVHTTGQSGHAYRQHYADMAPLWANIQYYSMLWDLNEVMSQAERYLRLFP